MRAFEGPDPALEPVHEFHFVGQPPEQRLRDVHMALDEARNDDAPERSTRSASAFSGRPASPGPMSAMTPFSMSMSVSRTSRAGFMVMTVALASSVRMCFLLS